MREIVATIIGIVIGSVGTYLIQRKIIKDKYIFPKRLDILNRTYTALQTIKSNLEKGKFLIKHTELNTILSTSERIQLTNSKKNIIQIKTLLQSLEGKSLKFNNEIKERIHKYLLYP